MPSRHRQHQACPTCSPFLPPFLELKYLEFRLITNPVGHSLPGGHCSVEMSWRWPRGRGTACGLPGTVSGHAVLRETPNPKATPQRVGWAGDRTAGGDIRRVVRSLLVTSGMLVWGGGPCMDLGKWTVCAVGGGAREGRRDRNVKDVPARGCGRGRSEAGRP